MTGNPSTVDPTGAPAGDGGITVIVGTDGSAHALHAAATGVPLLERPGRVVVVTAAMPVDEMLLAGSGFAGGVVSPETFDDMTAARRAEGEEIVARTAAALTGFPVETVVAWGDPGQALVTLAEELAADAIVVGSRGLGGVKRFFMGSVSTSVVQRAPCPVLVVPSPDD